MTTEEEREDGKLAVRNRKNGAAVGKKTSTAEGAAKDGVTTVLLREGTDGRTETEMAMGAKMDQVSTAREGNRVEKADVPLRHAPAGKRTAGVERLRAERQGADGV